MALIFDLTDPQEMLGFVRALPFSDFSLATFLPNDDIDDIEYRYTRDDRVDQDVAPYRSWDAEAAIGERQAVSRIIGEIPPLSKKIRLGEESRLRLRQLQGATGDAGRLVTAIFNDAANMARAVAARTELARGRALYDGKFVVNENGFQQTIDFGIPGAHRVTPATVWSTFATATPISDMLTWLQTYVDTNGFPPAFALTSTAVLGNLLRSAEVRTFAASLAGSPTIVSRPVLNQVLSDYNLPALVINDELVRVAGVSTRVIPSDRFVYLPPAGAGLGNTFFGITAEAIELAEARAITTDQMPGMVAVVDRTFDPVATWTKAAATAMPVIRNPKQILTADVQ